MVRPRRSRESRLPPVVGIAALLSLFFALGCGPAKYLSSEFQVSGVAPARIDRGRGVRLSRVDGQRIDRRSILVEPGMRSLRFDVRRHMGPLDKETLEGIYRVGVCRVRFAAEAGKHYQVYTKIFSEERTTIRSKRPAALQDEPEIQTVVGLTVQVLDVERGRNRRLNADSCELKLDCSRVNRLYARAGKECSF